MSPTVTSWAVNPQNTGPVYPFVGWETGMIIAGATFFLGFMFWKFRTEKAKYATQASDLQKSTQLHRLLGIDPD